MSEILKVYFLFQAKEIDKQINNEINISINYFPLNKKVPLIS